MRLEHASPDWLKREVKKVLTKYLDPSDWQFFFFGSRVKGDNFERADIDIGVLGDEKLPATTKLDIQDELEKLSILYKIDLVDFSQVTSEFKNEALKHTESI